MESKETLGLESIVEDSEISKKKIVLVDTGGNITYSLVVGSFLDYYTGLHTLAGIAASRLSATGMNIATGSPYGLWREKCFDWTKTEEEERSVFKELKESYINIRYNEGDCRELKKPLKILIRKARKTTIDLTAFNTFQIPIYAIAVAIGSFVSEGEINLEKIENGARNLAVFSPLVGPTLGWYMDWCRKLFGIKSAVEGAYENN